MARPSRTGGKTSAAQARNAGPAKGRKTTKTKRRIAPAANPPKRFSAYDLKHQLERCSDELLEAREQQAATAEILKVINASPGNLTPVFDIILEKAHGLCDVPCGSLQLFDDGHTRAVAVRGMTEPFEKFLRQGYRLDRSQPVHSGRPFQIDDLTKVIVGASHGSPLRVAFELGGLRTMLSVPLVRDGVVFGRIVAGRQEVRPFSEHQIAVLQSFADQALIAIENARLFNETKEALERQTATADILKVIASSPSDVQPVFEAVVNSAARLFEPCSATITTLKEGKLHWNAMAQIVPSFDHEAARAHYPIPFDSDRSPSTRAILERRIVSIPDTHAPDTPEYTRRVSASGGFRSITFVPLIHDNRGIGTIILTHPQTGFRFSDKQLGLLQTFADQAVIAIENVRLFNEVQAKTADLSESLQQQTATADVLKVISRSAFDLQNILDTLIESAALLCTAERATLIHQKGQTYVRAALHGFPKEAVAEMKNVAVDLNSATIASRALRQCAVVHVADVNADPDYPKTPAQLLGGVRTVISVPLVREGRPIGAITLSRTRVDPFTPKQIDLIRTFADQALIAIENARLFNETKEALERQTATADILKVIASSPSDVQPVFDTIAEQSNRLLNGLATAVYSVVDDVAHLMSFTPVSPAADAFLKSRSPVALAETAWGGSIRNGDIFTIADTESESVMTRMREISRIRGWRSALFVPLRRERTLIGAISVTRREPGVFAAHHIDLLKTFADQAVIAISNVELFQQLENRTKELSEALQFQTASSDVLKVISSSPDTLQPVLDAIVQTSRELCGSDASTIFLIRDDKFHFTAVSGDVPKHLEYLRDNPASIDEPLFGRLVRERRTLHFANVMDDPELSRSPRNVLGGPRALLVAPLLRDGEPLGAIVLRQSHLKPFTSRQIQAIEVFADQAVIAISNVGLFEEVQAKTRDLSEALTYQTGSSKVLSVIASSPTDIGPVLKTIVESACELCDAYDAVVRLKVGNDLVASAHHGPIPADTKKWRINRNWTAGRAIIDKQPVHVHDVLSAEGDEFPESREIARHQGHRTALSVPLLREGESIGAIILRRNEVHPFSDKQIALLQTFADQAVIAIENVRLFDEVQARTGELSQSVDELRALGEVSQAVNSTVDLETVLNTIVANATQLSGTEAGAIYVFDQTVQEFHLRATYGMDGAIIREIKDRRIHIGDTLVGEAVQQRMPIQIPDIQDDPSPLVPDVIVRAGFRALLIVPLLGTDRTVGALVVRRKQPGEFPKHTVDLLQTFAAQSVLAIQNARLFEEVQAKTRDLTEALTYQTGSSNILSVIASSPTDVAPTLKAIVESACEICDANDAVVFLKDGGDLVFSAHHGPIPINLERWPINRKWITGRAVVDRAPQHIHDLLGPEGDDFPEARELQRNQGQRTVLSVPLLQEDKAIGAISLRRIEVQPFNDKQIELLKSFADQAVIAISNVRLFEEVQARTYELAELLEQQTATSEVLSVISRSAGDLAPVFDAMLGKAMQLCGANFGVLNTYDGSRFHTAATYGLPPAYDEFRRKRPLDYGPATAPVRLLSGDPFVQISDLLESDAYRSGEPNRRALVDLGGARCLLAVPLLKDERVTGNVMIFRQENRPFSEKQITLLQQFAAQAVIAIENARLLNELRQRTNDLSKSIDDLRTAQDRLVQTEKLASLGQLTAGIAHEIKNPLNFVNNFSAVSAELTGELNDLLKDATLTDKMRQEVEDLTRLLQDNLEKVVQHGKRADSIVKNMLLHSREGSGEHRLADINAIVDESLNLAYHGARAEKPNFNVTMQRSFDPAVGTADVYPQEITRVLLNLISNGFYATAKRKTEAGDGFEPTLTATTKDLGDNIEIRIRDNGTGIPDEVKVKIFNPFFTTKPAGEGTGLGLSMSHDIIVKQHGGKIDVETEPGQFTEFRIVLPRTNNFTNK